MTSLNVKLFDSHADFSFSTSGFASAMTAIHNQAQRGVADLDKLAAAGGRVESTFAPSRFAGAGQSVGLMGDRFSRASSGLIIFESATRGALRGLEGVDKSVKNVISGLANATTSFVAGSAIGGIVGGVATAAVAIGSQVMQGWLEELAEAKERVEDLRKSVEKLKETQESVTKLEFAADGAVGNDRAAALSKLVNELKILQASEDDTAKKQAAVDGANPSRRGVLGGSELDMRPESEKGSAPIERQMSARRGAAFAVEDSISEARTNLAQAEEAVKNAKTPGERAEALKVAIDAANEFRAMLVALASDPNLRQSLSMVLSKEDFARLVGAEAIGDSLMELVKRINDLMGQLKTTKTEVKAAEDDKKTKAEEDRKAKSFADFDRRRAMLGASPELKEQIQREAELQQWKDEAIKQGEGSPEQIKALEEDFATDWSQRHKRTPKTGFVGLQDGWKMIQQQVYGGDDVMGSGPTGGAMGFGRTGGAKAGMGRVSTPDKTNEIAKNTAEANTLLTKIAANTERLNQGLV